MELKASIVPRKARQITSKVNKDEQFIVDHCIKEYGSENVKQHPFTINITNAYPNRIEWHLREQTTYTPDILINYKDRKIILEVKGSYMINREKMLQDYKLKIITILMNELGYEYYVVSVNGTYRDGTKGIYHHYTKIKEVGKNMNNFYTLKEIIDGEVLKGVWNNE